YRKPQYSTTAGQTAGRPGDQAPDTFVSAGQEFRRLRQSTATGSCPDRAVISESVGGLSSMHRRSAAPVPFAGTAAPLIRDEIVVALLSGLLERDQPARRVATAGPKFALGAAILRGHFLSRDRAPLGRRDARRTTAPLGRRRPVGRMPVQIAQLIHPLLELGALGLDLFRERTIDLVPQRNQFGNRHCIQIELGHFYPLSVQEFSRIAPTGHQVNQSKDACIMAPYHNMTFSKDIDPRIYRERPFIRRESLSEG